MMIVVCQRGVIVVLTSGHADNTGTMLSAFEGVVIVSTKETVLPQSELVAGLQPPHASAAPKALHVIDFGFRSHYIVIFAKALATLVAFRAEQPVYTQKKI